MSGTNRSSTQRRADVVARSGRDVGPRWRGGNAAQSDGADWGRSLTQVIEVAAGPLLGGDGGRGGEVGSPVRAEGDLPAGGGWVEQPVVVAAEQHQVGQVGGSAVGPVGHVVGVGPAWWPVAVGEGAAA